MILDSFHANPLSPPFFCMETCMESAQVLGPESLAPKTCGGAGGAELKRIGMSATGFRVKSGYPGMPRGQFRTSGGSKVAKIAGFCATTRGEVGAVRLPRSVRLVRAFFSDAPLLLPNQVNRPRRSARQAGTTCPSHATSQYCHSDRRRFLVRASPCVFDYRFWWLHCCSPRRRPRSRIA
jgi:hypothetical protein